MILSDQTGLCLCDRFIERLQLFLRVFSAAVFSSDAWNLRVFRLKPGRKQQNNSLALRHKHWGFCVYWLLSITGRKFQNSLRKNWIRSSMKVFCGCMRMKTRLWSSKIRRFKAGNKQSEGLFLKFAQTFQYFSSPDVFLLLFLCRWQDSVRADQVLVERRVVNAESFSGGIQRSNVTVGRRTILT